ncbi:MAG: branched-chain amino acid ABC transporter permease [Bacillati bacterium ANGP1]|uniref:Branched-chain amino acid ABC transporter permease n=1 Tax=Candidatus Segetimicrobium genomatis TaxID=2569760 RepID=A0A537K053_9BACT|nr:MAG: branched-chain amino acid ABC transporter permease [Terrabacteria group bacterium ANGP1]
MTWERAGFALLAAGVAALPVFVSTAYALALLNIIGLYAIVTVGLVLLGCSGQVSLGQAAFYGLGAYGSALLSRGLGWSPWLTIPAATAAVAGVAYAVGLPALRLAGHFFVLATLGFGVIVNVLMVQLVPVTGGGNGLRDIPPLQIAGIRPATERQFYYLIWTLALGALLLARNITSHRTGRALRAILGSEVAAAALGVEVSRYKMQVFVASAAYAALAGAVYAHYIRFISPSPFALYASLFFLIMAVVGGLTNIWGGLFGAAAVTVLDQVIRAQVPRVFPRVGGEYQTAIYGVLLVVIMIFFPRGLVRGAIDLRHAQAHPLPVPGGTADAEPAEEWRA